MSLSVLGVAVIPPLDTAAMSRPNEEAKDRIRRRSFQAPPAPHGLRFVASQRSLASIAPAVNGVRLASTTPAF